MGHAPIAQTLDRYDYLFEAKGDEAVSVAAVGKRPALTAGRNTRTGPDLQTADKDHLTKFLIFNLYIFWRDFHLNDRYDGFLWI